MNNKKPKPRVEKIFERLENQPKFLLEVKKYRTIAGYPTEGFKSFDDYFFNLMEGKLQNKSDNNHFLKIVKLGKEILAEQRIDIDFSELQKYIKFFILVSKSPKRLDEVLKYFGINILRIITFNESGLEQLKATNPKGAIITISPNTTKKELMDFVKNDFSKVIKPILGSKNPFRIKDYKENKRDKNIYRLFGVYSPKNIDELRRIANDPLNVYDKYVAIAIILKKKHNINNINADHLKTIIHRMGKRLGR